MYANWDVIWRKTVSTNAIREIHVGGFSELGDATKRQSISRLPEVNSTFLFCYIYLFIIVCQKSQ